VSFVADASKAYSVITCLGMRIGKHVNYYHSNGAAGGRSTEARSGSAPSASQFEKIIVTAERCEQVTSTIGISNSTATDDRL